MKILRKERKSLLGEFQMDGGGSCSLILSRNPKEAEKQDRWDSGSGETGLCMGLTRSFCPRGDTQRQEDPAWRPELERVTSQEGKVIPSDASGRHGDGLHSPDSGHLSGWNWDDFRAEVPLPSPKSYNISRPTFSSSEDRTIPKYLRASLCHLGWLETQNKNYAEL